MSAFFDSLKTFGQRVLTGHLVRRSALSFIFGVLVILMYYLLRLLVPEGVPAYQQVVTVVFIIISVLILFPAREAILKRLLSRYEYLAFFGHDFHHLELMARHFSIDTLVTKIFPEFTQWLGVSGAGLAILDASRKHYGYYIWQDGALQSRTSPMEAPRLADELLRFMKKNRSSFEIIDENIPDYVRACMQNINAELIHPFIYRKSLVGYLILNQSPRHPFAVRALEFFADKAAVAIQNNILSFRVIDSQLYDQELQTARRIQRTLHETQVPEIKGYKIQTQGHGRSILEFYSQSEDKYYLVVLSADRITGAAGIVLYGLLGTLYAILQRETEINMYQLLKVLRADPDYNRAEYRIDILIAEILPGNPRMMILMEGDHYSLYESQRPDRTLISRGWRNYVDIAPDSSYRLAYRNTPLLSIEFSGTQDHKAPEPEGEHEWIPG